MRIVITGAAGFVAPYFIEAVRKTTSNAEIFACGRRTAAVNLGESGCVLDVTDEKAVSDLIARVNPTHVMHLAAVSAPLDASADPKAAWAINLFGTTNLARAILAKAPQCILMLAGSGEVYGSSANHELPLTENTLLNPISEYALTKAAADLAIGAFAKTGLRCIRFRPFNHIGPGQTEKYALSSFAAQIARIELGLQSPVIRVGNLNVERDFLDVRDVADAYVRGALRFDQIPTGSVLNIASGIPRRLGDLLSHLIGLSSVSIGVEQDPTRVRQTEVPKIYGDASKASLLLNWSPTVDFKLTLYDLLTDWRQRIGGARR
jgi:GDP-4-dehydro-6-deoxy-D-mannose reductase